MRSWGSESRQIVTDARRATVSRVTAPDDYFLEIEAHFAARRGTPFILSAKDWALMKSWGDEGIPLPIVIEAIDSVFDKAAERGKVVNSLSWARNAVKHAVKELWGDRKELQIGAAETVPEAGPEVLLEQLASQVADEVIASQIRDLVRERSLPKIEDRLIAIEKELIDRAVTRLSPADVETIRGDIAAAIGGTKLDEKTRARTEEAMMRRIVRDRFGLPRLTLFG
jgi:hypothetical protein